MIKVIAFDLGGVLFAEGKSVLIKRLSKEKDYDKDVVLSILKSPKSIDLRKGLITDEEFWTWAQKQLPNDYDAQLIKKEWYDSYLLDRDILELAKSLKNKYQLIIFSGNIKSRIKYLDEKYDFRRYFDKEVYSFDYHLNKPQKEFVEVMIKEAGVKPEEIAYIDDYLKDAAPAKELRVNIIIYSKGQIDKLQKELQQIGVDLEDQPK